MDRAIGQLERRLTFFGYGALTLALFASQYVTLPRAKALIVERTAGITIHTAEQEAVDTLLANATSIFSAVDVAIGLTIPLSFLLVVFCEARYQTTSRLLGRAAQEPALLMSLLGFAALVITRYYLNDGSVFMGDAQTHMIRSSMVAEHLRNGTVPAWSNYWYGGFPLLEYYAPLYQVLTAVLTLVFGDIQVATKFILWSSHVASFFAMYLFLRQVTRSELGPFVGAVAYGLCAHRVHIILYKGDLQLSLVFLLYPLILLTIERFFSSRTRARRSFLVLTLLTAALILNHQAYAFFGLVFACVWLVVRTLTWQTDVRTRIRSFAFVIAGFAAATLLCAFMLVPFMLEWSYVRGGGGMPFHLLIPNPRGPIAFLRMFAWTLMGDDVNIGYYGISIGVFALIGAVFALGRRSSPAIALFAGALISILMIRNLGHYNIKNINFFMFFLCALAGWAPAAIVEMLSRLERFRGANPSFLFRRVSAAALGLLALDLGATTFHDVFLDGEDYKEPMYARIRALDGNYRVIERQVLRHVPGEDPRAHFEEHRLGMVTAFSPISSPLGWFHEAAGEPFAYNVEMVKRAHRDLHDRRLSEPSLDGLYLMGVRYLLFRDRFAFFVPEIAPSSEYASDGEIVTLARASPLIASARLESPGSAPGYAADNAIERREYFDPETYDYDPALYESAVLPLVAYMGIDRKTATARALLADSADFAAAPQPDAPRQLAIERFEVTLETATIDYELDAEAFGRLSFTWFPYLDVRVDDEPIPFHPSAMGSILVRLPAGAHTISVRGVASPLRKQTFAFSLAVLVGIFVVPGRAFRRFESPT
jgi:hypothetical protein